MELARGAVVGAAIGASVAAFLQWKSDRKALGVETEYLQFIPTLSEKLSQFSSLRSSSPSCPDAYASMIQTADQFAGHMLHFTRASQFKCNRLICELGEKCRDLCILAQSADGVYLREHGWAEVEKVCNDMLHNRILDM